MAEIRVNPTRMEQKKLKSRLAVARRGHKLMRDKRDELMRQFLDVVKEAAELRRRVEEALVKSYRSFSAAAALMSPKQMSVALMLAGGESELEVSTKNVMGVDVPRFEYSVGTAERTSYGMAFTSAELDLAVTELSSVIRDMIRLAELEKTSQLLAEQIEKARRRVNALEHIMIPQIERAISSISMKLDENERANTTRLMKVKDMMLEKKIEADRKNET